MCLRTLCMTVRSKNLVRNYIAFIPLLHGRTMERHPGFVDRNNILAARNRRDDSPSREEMSVRQRTSERRRSELVENAARANCSTDSPPWQCRPARDNRVQVQEMSCHGLNRLRRVLPVMLHAIRIAKEGVERGCIAAAGAGTTLSGILDCATKPVTSAPPLTADQLNSAQQPADAPRYRCVGPSCGGNRARQPGQGDGALCRTTLRFSGGQRSGSSAATGC